MPIVQVYVWKGFGEEKAKTLIKNSITRIESNASSALAIVSAIATVYGAIVGFWVTDRKSVV